MRVLFFLFTLNSFIYSFSQGSFTDLSTGSAPGNIELDLKNTQGGLLSLKKAIKEGGLLVAFSCNTCPFVVGTKDFPGWESGYNLLYKEAKKLKIGMVLINSNEAKRDSEDSFENMIIHSEKMNYLMPYLLDNNSNLANAFGAKTTPHVFLLDNTFRLVYKGSIDNLADNEKKKFKPYLLNAMLALSNNKKPKPAISNPVGCSIKRIKN